MNSKCSGSIFCAIMTQTGMPIDMGCVNELLITVLTVSKEKIELLSGG